MHGRGYYWSILTNSKIFLLMLTLLSEEIMERVVVKVIVKVLFYQLIANTYSLPILKIRPGILLSSICLLVEVVRPLC